MLIASIVSFITIPLSGHISDLIRRRRRMYLIGAVALGIFGFIYFGLLDAAVPALVFVAIVISHDMMYRPQAALIAAALMPDYTGSAEYDQGG